MKGIIFGDSILRGMFVKKDGKRCIWKNNWLTTIYEQCGLELTNHSQIGCTVQRGAMLLEKAAERGLEGQQLVLLEYGGNDADFDWGSIAAEPGEKHFSKTPLQLFEQIYGKLIERVRSLQIKPLLVTPVPVIAGRYLDWLSRDNDRAGILKWLSGDETNIYRYQEMYALSVCKLAGKYDCPLLDIRSTMLERRDLPELMSPDGLHPVEAGYELIWQEIAEFFRRWLPVQTELA